MKPPIGGPEARETEQLIRSTLFRFRSNIGAGLVSFDDLWSIAAEAIAKARADWNGKGYFGPFAIQRATWKIQATLRKLARRHGRGETREHLLAAAATTGACLAAETGPPLEIEAIPDLIRGAAASFDVEMDSAPLTAMNDSAEEVERDADRIRLRRAVEALPDPARTVMERYYYHGDTFEEIAAAVGLGRSTVFDVHNRTLRALSQRFRPADADAESRVSGETSP